MQDEFKSQATEQAALVNEASVRCNGRSMEGSRWLIHAAAEALYLPPEHSRRTHRSIGRNTDRELRIVEV